MTKTGHTLRMPMAAPAHVRDTGAAEQPTRVRQGQAMNPYIIIEDARVRSRDLIEKAERSRTATLDSSQVRQSGQTRVAFLNGIQRISRRIIALL